MIEHHIQRKILERLMTSESLRFSELKPDGMESNIFMYHLRQLQKQDFILKTGDGYGLAHKGLQYVDGLQSGTLKPYRQPKLIAIVILENKDGHFMLAERKTQPYVGTRMFMSGTQHFNESFPEQSARELREKGLPGVQMEYRGVADVQISHDDELLTHVFAHVHYGTYDGDLPIEDDRFRYVWHDFNDTKTELVAGTREIYELIRAGAQFSVDLKV